MIKMAVWLPDLEIDQIDAPREEHRANEHRTSVSTREPKDRQSR
jgi:hypothetical protein